MYAATPAGTIERSVLPALRIYYDKLCRTSGADQLYWDWQKLGSYLVSGRDVVEYDADACEIPLGFWIRFRL